MLLEYVGYTNRHLTINVVLLTAGHGIACAIFENLPHVKKETELALEHGKTEY